jgi:hypothetical protein
VFFIESALLTFTESFADRKQKYGRESHAKIRISV